jgi:hypothetical protein
MVRIGISLAMLVAFAPLFETRGEFPRFGIFRKKKDDPPAAEKDKAVKAKQLVEKLKSDPDEKKRLAAVEELVDYDPRTHLDVLPTLVNSLKQDPSPAVRAAAAEVIGEMKPVQQNAGVALEQTNANDPSESVRKAAQQALWQYHLNGYRSAGANATLPQTAEPPLAKPKAKSPIVPIASPVKQSTTPATPVSNTKPQAEVKGGIYPQTAEPPLAKPKPTVQPPTPSLAVPPLPVVPTVPTVPPSTTPSVPPPNG